MDDRQLIAAWRDIAANDEGNPVIRMDRAVLRSFLDLVERNVANPENGANGN